MASVNDVLTALENEGDSDTIALIDPIMIDDAVRRGITAAGRLLRFERYLDRLEMRKAERGTLPGLVESSAVAAFDTAQADAAVAAAALVDVGAAFQASGSFGAMLPRVAAATADGLAFREFLERALPQIEEYILAQGMPVDDWRWAFEHLRGEGIAVRGADDGTLLVTGGDRQLAIRLRHPTNMPLVDGYRFITEQLHRMIVPDQMNARKRPIPTSLYGNVLAVATYLVEEYERRAQRTRDHGVVVEPDGFAWWIIVIIIIVALALVGGGIQIACDNGALHGTVCVIGEILILLAVAIWCIWTWTEGNPPVAEKGGIMCIMTFNPDSDPDDG
jgi:hypothetical protein